MNKRESEKHASCNNCYSCSKAVFKNNVIFCAGLIKRKNPPCDKYRFCIIKDRIKSVNNIMIEEALALLQIISSAVLTDLSKRPLTKKVEQIYIR